MAKSTVTLEFDRITQELKPGIQNILSNNKETFKKCVSDEVHRSVYPLYTPSPQGRYVRRMDNGGLSDTDNYEVIEGDLSLKLINRTESGQDYWKFSYSMPITELVEEGKGHGWVGVPERPFMDKALDTFAHDIIEPQIIALLGGKK